MNVAVIGAGWAGLAAAVRLRRLGHEPWVFEAARQIGGRARPVYQPAFGTTIDNGQHILLGAYHETLGLMRELGVDPALAFHTQALRLASVDGHFRLGTWPLPAPAHGLGILLGGRGLSLRDRYSLARVLLSLSKAPQATDTVAQWLARQGSTHALRRLLWEPLCLAAMNTPLDIADARLFVRVLRDSLGASAQASRLLIPRGTLDELWPAQARAQLPRLATGRRISMLESEPNAGYRVDGIVFDAVILATPPGEAARLLQTLPNSESCLADWPDWQHESIGTVTLRLAQPWGSNQAMSMLEDQPGQAAFGQWLFDRSAFSSGAAAHYVHVVISGASRYAGHDAATVIDGVVNQIRRQARQPLPAIQARTLVTEKRATFSAVPGLRRPGTLTPWPRLLLAGDWTATAYPAVLEGAVRSGLQAAEALK